MEVDQNSHNKEDGKMGHYGHLTTENRETAMILHEKGFSFRAIAAKINCSASTISREFNRNARPDGSYSASYADKQYRKRRKRCGPKPIMKNPVVARYVVERLHRRWTPEQIAQRARLDKYQIPFSFVTIYRAIDQRILPYSIKKLMRFKSKYKKHKKDDKRGIMQGLTGIEKRPASVNKRKIIGHWESDTILGQRRTGAIGTHVERKTGYLIAFQLNGGKSEEYTQATIQHFICIPPKYRRSFTVDRGMEFTNHRELTERLNMPVYFCDPYSPWQRGTNENTNGLLRQFFPKGTSFASITQEQLEYVVNLINHRPRKRLGWKTPAEVFFKNLFR